MRQNKRDNLYRLEALEPRLLLSGDTFIGPINVAAGLDHIPVLVEQLQTSPDHLDQPLPLIGQNLTDVCNPAAHLEDLFAGLTEVELASPEDLANALDAEPGVDANLVDQADDGFTLDLRVSDVFEGVVPLVVDLDDGNPLEEPHSEPLVLLDGTVDLTGDWELNLRIVADASDGDTHFSIDTTLSSLRVNVAALAPRLVSGWYGGVEVTEISDIQFEARFQTDYRDADGSHLIDLRELNVGAANLLATTSLEGHAAMTFQLSEALHTAHGPPIVSLRWDKLVPQTQPAVYISDSFGTDLLQWEQTEAQGVVLPVQTVTTGATDDVASSNWPDFSPEITNIEGDYTQGSTEILVIEIEGPGPGTGYDQLNISGHAQLDGTLQVVFHPLFSPSLGDTFEILTYRSLAGDFATYEGLKIGDGLFLQPVWGETALVLEVQAGPAAKVAAAAAAARADCRNADATSSPPHVSTAGMHPLPPGGGTDAQATDHPHRQSESLVAGGANPAATWGATGIGQIEPRLQVSGTAPTLPGLHLVDPTVDRFDGQLIYLDFDGAEDVDYNGPVTVENIDVPAFSAPGSLAGQEQAIIAEVLTRLDDTFASTSLTFVTKKPRTTSPYSTIYVGGDDDSFSSYGTFSGLAEQVDIGNRDPSDNGFVFSSHLGQLGVTFDQYVDDLTHLISHEIGHLVGYGHDVEALGVGPLAAVAANGTATIEFTSIPSSVDPGERVDVQVRFKISGSSGSSWDINKIGLYEQDITFDATISETGDSDIGAMSSQNTWYVWTFSNVDLSAYDDYGDGAEVYAKIWVDDNSLNGVDAVDSTPVTTVTVNRDTEGPYAPTNLEMEEGDGYYSRTDNPTFDWSQPSDRGGGTVVEYRYDVDDSSPDRGTTSSSDLSSYPDNLSNGSHTFYVQAKDNSNNWGDVAQLNFYVDDENPDSPTIDLTSGSDSGYSNTDNITNDSSPQFYFSGMDDSYSGIDRLYFRVDSGSWNYVDEPGSTEYVTLASQGNGNHTLYAYTTDEAGNTSSTSSLSFTIDTSAPSTPWIDLRSSSDSGYSSSDNIIDDNTPTLDFGASGSPYRFWYDVDDSSPDQGPTTGSSWITWALGDGNHTVYVQAEDAAGNWSSAGSLDLTVDTVAPSTPSPQSPSDGASVGGQTVVLQWSSATDATSGIYNYQLTYETAAPFDEVTIDVSGTSKQLTLGYDHWYWRLRVTDRAGNQSGVSTEYDFTLVAPDITSVRWEDSNGNPLTGTVNEGTTLYLAVYATGFSTSQVFTADVFEDDLWPAPDVEVASNLSISHYSGNKWRGAWVAQYRADVSGDPEYYFTVDTYGDTSDNINVHDTTAPGAPLFDTGSSTHQPDVWSKEDDLDIYWTEPTDASGIDGYSVLINNSSSGTPDTTVDTTDRHISLANEADTSSLWVHVSAKDKSGNWSSGVGHFGPFKIDDTDPNLPTASSPGSTSSSDPPLLTDTAPTFTWGSASDSNGSGISHYILDIDRKNLLGVWVATSVDDRNVGNVTNYPLPSGDALATDEYRWRVKAVDKVGKESGWSERFFVKEPPKPDLIVTSVTDVATSYVTGERINARAYIKNDGAGQAGETDLHYYLGTSSNKTYFDIGQGSIGSLNPGETEDDLIANLQMPLGWTIPDSIVSGTYEIWVLADSNNNEDEGSAGEENNWGHSPSFTIAPPFEPYFDDVRIASGSIVDENGNGYMRQFAFEFDVDSNVAGQFYVKLYEDDPSLGELGDDLIWTSPSFSVDGTIDDYHSYTVVTDDHGLSYGEAEFVLRLYDAATDDQKATWAKGDDPDLGHVKVELSSEDKLPDLVVEDIKLGGETDLSTVTFYPGDRVSIDALSKNVGDIGSKTSVPYKWWWGHSSGEKHEEITDGNENDISGSIAGINGLGVNEEEWVSETVLGDLDPDNWVVSLTPGTYWLTFEIDSPSANQELNEDNNWRSEQFVITQPNRAPSDPTNLHVVDVTQSTATIAWDPSSDADGDQITYKIQYGKDWSWDGWNPSEPLSTTANGITIAGLEEGKTYDLKIWADDGQGGISNEVVIDKLFTTAQFVPSFDDVRIVSGVDNDDDGYMQQFGLAFDVDSNLPGNYYVEIWEDDPSIFGWGNDKIDTTPILAVNGDDDVYYTYTVVTDDHDLGLGTAEFVLKLYNAATGDLAETWHQGDDPALGNVNVEFEYQDATQATIVQHFAQALDDIINLGPGEAHPLLNFGVSFDLDPLIKAIGRGSVLAPPVAATLETIGWAMDLANTQVHFGAYMDLADLLIDGSTGRAWTQDGEDEYVTIFLTAGASLVNTSTRVIDLLTDPEIEANFSLVTADCGSAQESIYGEPDLGDSTVASFATQWGPVETSVALGLKSVNAAGEIDLMPSGWDFERSLTLFSFEHPFLSFDLHQSVLRTITDSTAFKPLFGTMFDILSAVGIDTTLNQPTEYTLAKLLVERFKGNEVPGVLRSAWPATAGELKDFAGGIDATGDGVGDGYYPVFPTGQTPTGAYPYLTGLDIRNTGGKEDDFFVEVKDVALNWFLEADDGWPSDRKYDVTDIPAGAEAATRWIIAPYEGATDTTVKFNLYHDRFGFWANEYLTTLEVPVSVGSPVPAEIEVKQDGSLISDDTSVFDFGSALEEDGGGRDYIFTINNLGDLGLSVDNVELENNNGFQVTQQPSGNVAGGGSTAFRIKMLADTPGMKSADVRFGNGDADGDENPFNFRVEGAIEDVIDPPVVDDQTFGVDENSANGTVVGMVQASDPDVGDILSFALPGGTGAFAIDANSGALTVADASQLDFETIPSFEFTVEVADQDSLSDTATVTVTLNNVNEAPVVGNQTFAVDENSANGTVVGTVIASDPDAGDTLSFALPGGTGAFAIDANSGALTVADASQLDFETIPSFEFTVEVADQDSKTTSQSIAVALTPVNDNAPVFTSAATAEVAENTTGVLTVTATDADQPAQTLIYSITGGADATQFGIDAATGELNFTAAPDYESPSDSDGDNVYQVDITADDQSGKTTSQSITITVTPINDNAPVFTSSATAEVAENTTGVLTVVATDADQPAQTVVYSIAGGADAAQFSLDAATGALIFLATPDYESPSDSDADNVYQVDVSADDQSGGTTPLSITVTVIPVNDNAPVFTSSATAEVAENTTGVLTVVATDADQPAQTVVYSITGGADAAQFSLDAATGALTFLTAPDYESPGDSDGDNVYQVDVEANDQDGETTPQPITVTVTPVNDNAPVFISAATVDVAENTTTVLTVVATDADQPTQTVIYSITGGVDAAQFNLNPTTGTLTFLAAPDYENPGDSDGDNVYQVDVEADDQSGGTTSQSIFISVTDINDPLVFTSSSTAAVAENTTTVLTVAATNPDRPEQTVVYSIIGGTDVAQFSLDVDTGELVFLTAPDYENPGDSDGDNVYQVDVSADDQSGGTTPLSITVTVIPVNDNAPVFTSAATAEVEENTTAVLTMVATDADLPAQTLVYSITGGTDAAQFSLDTNTGTLTFLVAPDYESPGDSDGDNVYQVEVAADDPDGETTPQSITVTVTPVSDNAPVFTSSATAEVAENTTPVLTVMATDADLPAQTLIYSITGGADATQFGIDAVTGELNFILAPDYESPSDSDGDNVYQVDIVADDQDGETTSQSITVTVTPVNDNAPLFTSSSTAEVVENTTAVLTVVATDADRPGQTVVYSIIGGADAAQFAIDAAAGVLTFLTAPDYESPGDSDADNVYQVDVAADDQIGSTQQQSITVSVTDVNEPLVFTSSSTAEVAENTTRVLTVVATDADRPGQTLIYSITGGADAAQFSLEADIGELVFTTAPDYESPGDSDGDNVYQVDVEADDQSGGTTPQSITVTVTPVNDNAPVFASAETAEVAENATTVLTVVATDADRPAQTLSYSIAGGADAAQFSLDTTTGALTFIAAPDYESPGDSDADNIYQVDVSVDDQSGESTPQSITVTVTPVNDNAPLFTSAATAEVVENAVGVLMVVATDADRPEQTVIYSITGGADAAQFSLDVATGALTFIAAPDYENPSDSDADNVYQVDVTADDQSGKTTPQSVTVNLNNANETPVVGDQTFAVDENSTNGTRVGIVPASDPEGDTLSFALAGGTGAFAIDTSSGEIIVADASQLDFETTSSYSLPVEVMDVGGLSNTATVTVNLNDVNEAPVVDDQILAVDENIANGTVVGAVTASDPDAGDTLSFALIGGTGAFAIDASSGEITVIDSSQLDFETTPSFEFTVEVTDQDGKTTPQSITVAVTPVNDNAPVFTSAETAEVPENTTAVMTVIASDADQPEQTVIYSITGGADAAQFGLDANTGVLIFLAAPDYESPGDSDGDNVYQVDVTADDQSGSTTSQSITVTVTPVNDNAPVFTSAETAEVAENTTAVLTVVATDADLPEQTVIYSIVGGTDAAQFGLDGATGELTFLVAPDYENPRDSDWDNVYQVDVEADDQGGKTTPQSITVTVTSVVEYTYDLPAGWSMISLPLVVEDPSLNVLFPSALSLFEFVPGKDYKLVSSMEPGKGYWINLPSSVTRTIKGTKPSSLQVHLPAGWSMVGPLATKTTLAGLGDKVLSVFSFDRSYRRVTDIEAGEGYWINLCCAVTVDLRSNGIAELVIG